MRFAEAIYTRFGVRYDPDHVGRIMHRLGLRERKRNAPRSRECRGTDPRGRGNARDPALGLRLRVSRCSPNTARRQSEISPTVAYAPAASRIGGIRLSLPRAACSERRQFLRHGTSGSATRAPGAAVPPAPARAPDPAGRSRCARSLPSGSGSRPPPRARPLSTARCYSYAAFWISFWMYPVSIARSVPPASSIRFR